MTTSAPLIFLTACEASGDLLGASIIAALKKRLPQARFVGVAGPLMRAQGCEVVLPQEDLSIMGLIEVLKHLFKLLKARRYVRQTAQALKPDIYIGVDAPDFNLPIETQLKKNGIKTVHVNSPTLWAWRAGRIHGIKRAVNLMLTLFPFEIEIYQQHHVPVKFIGHPLADKIPRVIDKIQARKTLAVDSSALIALMPGSRKAEIKHLAPLFLAAAKNYYAQHPQVHFIAPMINERRAAQFQAYLDAFADLPVTMTIGNAHEVLTASDAVLIASGTATLEALLCKTPMVICYKTDALSFWLAKRLVKIPHVGLPNILAGKKLVPELLQAAATPENIAVQLTQIMQSQQHTELLAAFDTIHQQLQRDAAQQASDAIVALIQS